MNERLCKNCGEKTDKAELCENCSVKAQEAPARESPALDAAQNASGSKINAIKAAAADIVSTTMFASETAGAMVFKQDSGVMEGLAEILGPIKLVISTVSGLFGKLKGALKDKKRLIPVIIMALVWLLQILLPKLGVNPGFLKFLSFLTFAQGGTKGGFLGLIGGIVGKGVFSYFIFSVIIPLVSGKNPLKGMGGTVKNIFSQFSVKSGAQLGPLLCGAGAALIAYNFFAGYASLQSSMAGVAAFFLALRAFSTRTGFVRKFITSIGNKLSKGKRVDMSVVNRFIAGLSAGFALAVPLSALPVGILPYLCGTACAVAGAILIFALKGKTKEACAV